MKKSWPTWPEDQLALFDLPEPTKKDKTENPEKAEKSRFIVTHDRICPVCGSRKTIGLPCGKCEEDASPVRTAGTETGGKG
jgi:hypothetical protein